MRPSSVAAQYADEAAFLWTTRARAVGSARFSLSSLTALDERIEAHLDGLRLSGDAGWAECRAALENIDGGSTFPLGVLAFEAGDRPRMLDALTAACASPEARRGLVSALAWIDGGQVQSWIGKLLVAQSPLHREIGIAACAARRDDPGEALSRAIHDPDAGLRARGLRAVGELKRRDLLAGARDCREDGDEACRFWASWALALLGERAGTDGLTRWLGRDDQFGRAALEVCLRAMPTGDGREWIRVMAKSPERRRSAVIGAGVLGDPASVSWLIEQMDASDLARVAGEAFTTVTGVDLEYNDLDRSDPADDGDAADGVSAERQTIDGQPVNDRDSQLPWPKQSLVERWWDEHARRFPRGVRHLAGRVLSAETASGVLATGTQPQRAAAAIELAVREAREPLFEVRAKGSKQRRLLSGRT